MHCDWGLFSCQWTFCMLLLYENRMQWWYCCYDYCYYDVCYFFFLLFLFTNLYVVHLSSGLRERARLSYACAHIFKAHICIHADSLSHLYAEDNSIAAACTHNNKRPLLLRVLLLLLLLLLLSLLHSFHSVSLNLFFYVVRYFIHSNTCITFCITFYSRQCSVSAYLMHLIVIVCRGPTHAIVCYEYKVSVSHYISLWLLMMVYACNIFCLSNSMRSTNTFRISFKKKKKKKWTLVLL